MTEQIPEEDITPREALPPIEPPEVKPASGWQAEPLPVEKWTAPCLHMGQIQAATQVGRYPLGAEWICPCGQVFVVAINLGGKRTLRKPEAVVETAEKVAQEAAEQAEKDAEQSTEPPTPLPPKTPEKGATKGAGST